MAILSDYTSGTVSASAGGTVVTGSGTAWLTAGFGEGDIFIAPGWSAIVKSVDSNTQVTLYPTGIRGAALTGSTYRMRYMSDGARVSGQTRQLIDLLRSTGSIEALAGVTGQPDKIPMFTGPGTMTLIDRQDLTQGIEYDAFVDNIAARAAYDNEAAGFAVVVADTGDGRSAVYTRVGAAGNWSAPAYITGPAVTLDVTEVDEVPYGTPPDVEITPVGDGSYNLKFEIPSGMMIQPGTVTTVGPDTPASVDFVPITGGYQINFSIPRGPTGDIDGVTPFWAARITTDTTAAAARAGLGATTVGNALFTAANATAAQDAIGATATGKALLTAADADAAQDAIGATATGKALLTAANATAAQDAIGATATGKALLTASNAAAARTGLGATTVGSALFTAADAATARATLGAQANLGYTPVNKAGDTMTGSLLVYSVGSSGYSPTVTVGHDSSRRGYINYNWTAGVGSFLGFVSQDGAASSQATFSTDGNFSVPGAISAGSKSFLIDHPLDPMNRDLRHVSVEAPEYQIRYRGIATLEDGQATVDIDAACGMTPGTFAALAADAWVCALLPQDSFERVKCSDVVDGAFTITSEDGGSTARVAWEVTARRKDPFVMHSPDSDEDGRLIVDFEKPEAPNADD